MSTNVVYASEIYDNSRESDALIQTLETIQTFNHCAIASYNPLL